MNAHGIFGEEFRLRRMARLVRGCRRVLDVGYGQLPNRHLDNEYVIGFDRDAATKPGNYTAVIRGDWSLLRATFLPESFDALVLGEVLEHVESPLALLRDCGALLRPGGSIVLSTPNPNSCIERLLTLTLSRTVFYTPDHLQLIPQRWLIRIMERAGFRDVRLLSGGFPIPFVGLVPWPRPWCYQTIAIGHAA